MATPIQSGAKQRGLWDTSLVLLLVLCALVGVGALLGQARLADMLHQVMRLSPPTIGILLVLSLVNFAMRTARWHLFTRCLDLPTSALQDTRHYLGGFAMSVTPGRVGELIRLRWIARETGRPLEHAAPLAVVDRAADLGGMAIVLGLAVLLSASSMGFAAPFAVLALAAAILALQPRVLSYLITQVFRLTGLMPRLMGRVRAAARLLGRFMTPGPLVVASTLSILCWLAEGCAFYLLLAWMGHALPFWTAVAIFMLATLAGGATGAPGGVGGAEAAMVALLTLEGVPLEVSIPATAVIRLTTLWFAIAIGMAVFPVAERCARAAR